MDEPVSFAPSADADTIYYHRAMKQPDKAEFVTTIQKKVDDTSRDLMHPNGPKNFVLNIFFLDIMFQQIPHNIRTRKNAHDSGKNTITNSFSL